MALCACYDLARTLSCKGFVVVLRTLSDRPLTGLGVTCEACHVRYELKPTRPRSRAELDAARELFACA